jgi:hypothetical protein
MPQALATPDAASRVVRKLDTQKCNICISNISSLTGLNCHSLQIELYHIQNQATVDTLL